MGDFTVPQNLFCRLIYFLVIMHLATRKIGHFNLTKDPTGAWMAQQMCEISAWDEGPQNLVCDHDNLFGQAFEATAENSSQV